MKRCLGPGLGGPQTQSFCAVSLWNQGSSRPPSSTWMYITTQETHLHLGSRAFSVGRMTGSRAAPLNSPSSPLPSRNV